MLVTTTPSVTAALQLKNIKNYICHNCKIKYFTANEKKTFTI